MRKFGKVVVFQGYKKNEREEMSLDMIPCLLCSCMKLKNKCSRNRGEFVLILFYATGCFTCIYMTMCLIYSPRKLKEVLDIEYFGIRVTEDCEFPCTLW